MGYEGEVLLFCPAIDFSNMNIVVVSGDTGNVCGHMLLNVGGVGGWYFQVAFLYDYPRYMDEPGYQQYLSENGKAELYRSSLSIPNPSGAAITLEQFMGKQWLWGVIFHNCGTFVEAVVEGGGGTTNGLFNCPVMVPSVASMNQGIGPPSRWGP